MKNKIMLLVLLLAALLPAGGCSIASILLSGNEPARIDREYDIAADMQNGEKIFVYVAQPSYIDTPVSIRKQMADNVEAYLKTYFEDSYIEGNILTYRDYNELESLAAGFDPAAKAKELGASKLLYIELMKLDMLKLSQLGYYSASMKVAALYYDVSTGEKLWPEKEKYNITSYDIECEKDVEKTCSRLATANAHCILRHFYDCERNKYRIADELADTSFGEW
ncbi:MAG: hypothetical protein AB7F23_01370 [Phycisphaerae bacterium]|jgi:hypothetical protein